MKNLAETIKSLIQLVNSLLQVAMLAALIGGGWWVYRTASDYLSKPIALPTVKMPTIEMAPIQLPEIKLPELPKFGPKKEEPPPSPYWRFDD
jgi:hypothetical protein